MEQTAMMNFEDIKEGSRAVAYIPIDTHMCSLELMSTGREAQTITRSFWHSGFFLGFRIINDPNEENEIPNKGTCLLFVPQGDDVYVFNEVLFYRVRVGNEYFFMCHSFTEGNPNEKRMYGRINVNAKARLMLGTLGAVPIIIDDISNTGLSIHLPKVYTMEIGDRAVILLDEEDVIDCVMISGEVVRKFEKGNSVFYGINVENSDDRENASTFIFRRLEQQVRRDYAEEDLIQINTGKGRSLNIGDASLGGGNNSDSSESGSFSNGSGVVFGDSFKDPVFGGEKEEAKEEGWGSLLEELTQGLEDPQGKKPGKNQNKPLVVWDDDDDVKIETW